MPSFTVYKGSKSGAIVEATTTREVGPDEVLVRITHSGVCGTDEHYLHRDQVLGHEGAGVAEAIGSKVTSIQVGDSVGWGYQHNACLNCKQCLTGRETLCPQRQFFGTHDLDQGSFGTSAVWKANFLFKLPASLSREYAAPLMCGGATVYSALASFGARPSHTVGILGIGGLGHLAIQFAAKMGCRVVVFSSSEDKRAEAMRLGASEFVATKGKTDIAAECSAVDHLLVCASFTPDWTVYLPIMAPGGTIYPLTVSHGDLTIPYMPLIRNELKIQGSLVASRQIHRDMLQFAALHKIQPVIEKFHMDVEGIETCMGRLRDGKIRYRGVLEVAIDERALL
ncbi:chaperonin 10-like protein [Peziza echinospora]|nr:chaperonin 10-like protein [Peziza echinospora]